MKVIDCYWEKKNLDLRVIEILVEKDDVFNVRDFDSLDAEYIVVKVPTGGVTFNFGLSALKFSMIESQISISRIFSTYPFNDRLISHISKKVQVEEVNSQRELEEVLDGITINMFSTDRIYLDPFFGPEISMKRYKNWIASEFEKGESKIVRLVYRDVTIGFSMFRIEISSCTVLLGGVFENFQNSPYGMLTPISPAIYLQRNTIECDILKTNISSNNMPIISLYNHLGYRIDKISNVFIKQNISL